ncbi:MAG: TIGR03643 family protein [Pseudomonas sp.]
MSDKNMPTLSLSKPALSEADISRIVEMAWEDRTPFEAIEAQFHLKESAVIQLMRRHMKPTSFRMWRKRMAGRVTKHTQLRGTALLRHRASHTRQ